MKEKPCFGKKVLPAFTYERLVRAPQALYYPPSGSGRDWYIIDDNGGSVKKYSRFDEKGIWRGPIETPGMDAKLCHPSMGTYNNWPSL